MPHKHETPSPSFLSLTDWLSFPLELGIRTDVVVLSGSKARCRVKRFSSLLHARLYLVCHECLGHFSQGEDHFVL
jgi:hypothetical protein